MVTFQVSESLKFKIKKKNLHLVTSPTFSQGMFFFYFIYNCIKFEIFGFTGSEAQHTGHFKQKL